MTAHEIQSERSLIIDILRGIAVAGMIIAHGIFFLHSTEQNTLNIIQGFLNLTIFTVFLFVSGLSTSRWINKLSFVSYFERTRNIGLKIISLYCGYAMVSIVAILTSKSFSIQESVYPILSALTFITPPNFTEYFVLFISISLLLIPLYPFIQIIQKSFILISIVSFISYFIGYILYPLTFSTPINELKALLAGGNTVLRFPLLFYLPVFLLGMWCQHISDTQPRSTVVKKILLLNILFIVVAISGQIWTRWPPSLGNLALGLSIGTLSFLILPYITQIKLTAPLYQFLGILGRHSMNLWIVHLLILFGYSYFVGIQYAELFRVVLGIFLVFSLTIALSTITTRGSVSFLAIGPFVLSSSKHKTLQNRYAFFTLVFGIIILYSFTQQSSSKTNSIYGNVMPTPQILNRKNTYTNISHATASSDRLWYVRLGTRSDTVQATVHYATFDGMPASIDPNDIVFLLDNIEIAEEKLVEASDTIRILFSTNNIKPGKHTVSATLKTTQTPIISNPVTIYVTEPLYIAWTFDWEGWDVSDQALQQMSFFSGSYGLPFTHFVSPRTFLDGVLSEKRRNEIKTYLLDRYSAGDELAFHLHMHFDFIKAAGITPRTTNTWGLRTNEGYDVPTSEYTPEEFQTLIQFGKMITRNTGLPEPVGYRAGGWFITSPLLELLETEGFLYDSSGREKPSTGAFRQIPWDLPIDIAPYYPDKVNQNLPGGRRALMEIPNTGGSTYDLSSEELIDRIAQVYSKSILEEPKMIVFVSHPQFASREFSKIPPVLSHLQTLSRDLDKGPVIFVTMSQIHALWETLLP